MGIVFRHRSGESAATAVLDAGYGDAYEEIYAEPPYNSSPLFTRGRFVERTRSQVSRPGFALVSVEDGSALAGFAFGLTIEAGRWWGGQPSRGVNRSTAVVLTFTIRCRGVADLCGSRHRGCPWPCRTEALQV